MSKKQATMARPLFTLRAAVRAALGEAGERGVTLDELQVATGAERREIQRALGALGEAGEKFAAPITAKNWRHFATEAQRDAWVAGAKPGRVALSADELRSIRIHADKVRASKMAPPPLGRRTVQPVTMRADAVVTSVAAPRGRYEPEPGYVGPFSQAGIGRDVRTGKAWGVGA